MIDLVTVVDHAVVLERSSLSAWMDVAGRMRQVRYDAAIDLQGLLKSALLARASGAPRVLGFSIWHLREKTARPFYSETDRGPGGAEPDRSRRSGEAFREGGRLGEGSLTDHVIYKNWGPQRVGV